ncbi:MAG TPA: hypothetical protein VKA19_00590 [Alphaproteobacteria bacterium]|jgi:hypothetical protein|nr:hypothetical protein [Alphaproteobacteria bacterium]
MRYRWTGTALAMAMVAAVSVTPSALQAKDMKQPATIGGHPNLNGIWEVMNGADWNLEAHSATQLKDFWRLGAFGAIPAGQSVVEGGTIPYKPGAMKKREENEAGWPKSDPEANCYLPGIPRATYMPYPFQIIQGTGNILMVYAYASANREINMNKVREPQIDTWMGISNGHWDGDTLVVTTTGFNDKTWLDRAGNYHSPAMKVTERFKLMDKTHIEYTATVEDPNVFTKPWTIKMPLYKHVEKNAELLDFKCVPFTEKLIYGDLYGYSYDENGKKADQDKPKD